MTQIEQLNKELIRIDKLLTLRYKHVDKLTSELQNLMNEKQKIKALLDLLKQNIKSTC
jgi:flagellar biosynthesis chaperone FliJ